MRAREPSTDELRYLAGRSLQRWAEELRVRLSDDDAARLMTAACTVTLVNAFGPDGAAAMLRQLADEIEAGESGVWTGRG
jgi:hypothetical protein